MELSDVRVALRRYWLVAMAAMVFWLVVGAMLAFLPEGRYRATATLIVSPTSTSSEPGASSVQVTNFQIPAILAVIESRSFAEDVAADHDDLASRRSVSVEATVDPGTGIVRVGVEGTEPREAAAWATALVSSVLEHEVTTSSLVDVRILDEATTPTSPVSPKRVPIAVGTFALGIISAVFASVAVWRTRKAFDVVEELERRLDIPVVGRIPSVSSKHRRDARPMDVLAETPELMEAFQSLRTNLELAFLGTSPERQVVAVASWGEGEGKSTVAAGLALTSAASGSEVLAVDADLRRPALHTRLGQSAGPGVADARPGEVARLVKPTGRRNLWFIPAGVPDQHPADVLTTTLEPVLEYARQRAWRVVVDSPPYQGIAETATVLSAARYVLLVVDARRMRLPEIIAMTTRLQASGMNVVGIALNRIPKSRVDGAYSAYLAANDDRSPARTDAKRLPEPRLDS